MFNNVLIVYNPKAGKGNGKLISCKISGILNKKNIENNAICPLTIAELEEAYLNAGKAGVDAVVIIGGDGTLSVNINAMVKANVDVPVYVFGKGTANDFAKFISTNGSYRKFKKYFNNKYIRDCDLIECKDNFAISVIGGGAFTNGVMEYNPKLKRIFGKAAYYSKAAKEALVMKFQEVCFEVDGEKFEEECFTFFIANTKNVGGIKKIASLSKRNDNLLDLIIIKKCKFWGKIEILFNLVFGRIHKSKNVKYIKGKDFKINPKPPITRNFTVVDIDGNAGGDFPVEVKVSNKKVRIFSPEKNEE